MARDNRHKVPFRRRREGKTDYRKRLRMLRSGGVRVVVRRSLRHTTVQMVRYDERGDRVVASATTGQLGELGWTAGTSNTPAAYLGGLLAGRRAIKAGITKAVLDIGLNSPRKGSKVFASLKGVVDAGLSVPHSKEVLPSEERIKGGHLKRPEAAKLFDEVKGKIMGI